MRIQEKKTPEKASHSIAFMRWPAVGEFLFQTSKPDRSPVAVVPQRLIWRRPLGDGQAVDAEVTADAGDDQEGPAGVDEQGEGEVGSQVPQLGGGVHGRQAQARQVAEEGAAQQGRERDGPVREGLVGEVGEDDLGGHAAEDEGHGQAEEEQPVLAHEGRGGRVEP